MTFAMEKKVKYAAIYIKEPTGGYSVSIPSLPGCFSQGETLEEAKVNIAEAIESHLESLRVDGEEIPVPEEELVSSVTVSVPQPVTS